MITREVLVKYIKENSTMYEHLSFENYSLEALVVLKVQIELSIHRKQIMKLFKVDVVKLL